MKAYRYESPEKGLTLEDIPVPEAGPGQVLLKVQAAGLCHSDCHIIDGTGDFVMKKPITLGHEVAGTIVKTGDGVSLYQPGDRVAVAQVSHPLAQASWYTAIGLGYDGGYASHALAEAAHLTAIPENVSFAQAAVATDSIATAYHAVMSEAGVDAATKIAIVGLGGLGLNGVTVAALQKATVYGVDIDSTKFDAAKQAGAAACFTSLGAIQDVKLDVIVDFAGVGSTTAEAIATVKTGGKVVLVGLGASEIKIAPANLVTRGITLVGSIGASIEELKIVLDLISSKSISPILEEIPFSHVAEGLQRLYRGEVKGRLFTDPSKAKET